ncbi:MAG: CPBP family intramembrane metalloprotease [Bacteroidia bacterium]|nr:CPBP family intramembrane metalloprotease [Bacteroidia bacterium]
MTGAMATMIIASIDLELGVSNLDAIRDFSDPAKVFWLKIIQIATHIFGFLIPSLLVIYLISKTPKGYLHLNIKPSIQLILLTVLIIIFSIPLINLLVELNNNISVPEFAKRLENWFYAMQEEQGNAIEAFMVMDNISSLLLNVFMVGVVAAVCEEVLFRGVIQKIFASALNKHVAIWITAFLFSAIHLQLYNFIPIMLLGAMFGYMLVWSGSLWVPIIAHFIHNTAVVVSAFVIDKMDIRIEQEMIGVKPEHIPMIISSAILVAFILYYMYKNRTSILIYAKNNNGPALNTDPQSHS